MPAVPYLLQTIEFILFYFMVHCRTWIWTACQRNEASVNELRLKETAAVLAPKIALLSAFPTLWVYISIVSVLNLTRKSFYLATRFRFQRPNASQPRVVRRRKRIRWAWATRNLASRVLALFAFSFSIWKFYSFWLTASPPFFVHW